MPSISARHHTEWLSLLEISGPFLSLPVLQAVFPQGLDDFPPAEARSLRADYDFWKEDPQNAAVHTAWVRLVLESMLGYSDAVLLAGQAIPAGWKADFPEHDETLRPDLMLVEPGTRAPHLLIQVFPPNQSLEKALPGSHWQASVATRMMELLHATEVRLGLGTNGEQWMLAYAPRGETTGFTTWTAGLWFDEPITLRAFRSLLGVPRFFGVAPEETLESLLAKSADDQQEITDQLGLQVRHAVEILVQMIDRADQDRAGKLLGKDVPPALLYEAALTVMMRLVFLLSAEERKLLPLDDSLYADHYAASTLRLQLRELADQQGEEVLETRYDAWSRLLALFRSVHGGIQHERLTLPPYGGSLFDPDKYPFLEGRSAAGDPAARNGRSAVPLPVNNRTVLHLLEALQMLQVGGEARRLSFRALDVEQIGHVYESLLDHQAVRAEEVVLGLRGAKRQEPEITLSRLEQAAAKKESEFLAWLNEQTGRSASALKNALANESLRKDADFTDRLLRACGSDAALYQRLLPFAGLVRLDDFNTPVVILPGSVYVTAGTTRRATGTHLTPRSLTEPVVQHTLEPLVYIGPAEGLPREQWRLRSSGELLALKVCDLAMGSGGMIVQADRYLAERLVEAWEIEISRQDTKAQRDEEKAFPGDFASLREAYLTPEGEWTADKAKAVPTTPDDRLVLARRLVAERCLYGVDKNPLAVEIAKLSLWLVTLAKDLPFTFLDHALKCGDSLVGASEDDFLRWAHRDASPAGMLDDELLRGQLEAARKKRRELEAFAVRDVRDAAHKGALLGEAEAAMQRVKLGCDLLVGVRLLGLKAQEVEDLQLRLLDVYKDGREAQDAEARRALGAAHQARAFHWEFEFPEVFDQGGLSAFVGNPPFIGGGRISTLLGDSYLKLLHTNYRDFKGQSDICALFFRRAYDLLNISGYMGLIATNTIAQADTRAAGLDYIYQQGGQIYLADSSMSWPGSAAVYVSIVHISKGTYRSSKLLNKQLTEYISPYIDATELGNPRPLQANLEKAFRGMDVLGMGFTMSEDEALELLRINPKNSKILFPYINGQDLNSSPTQSPSRWVINFFDWPLSRSADESWLSANDRQRSLWLKTGNVPTDYPYDVAEDYPECMQIVREKVYPERKNNPDKQRREIWWRFTRPRTELIEILKPLKRVLLRTRVTQTHAPTFVPTNMVYSDATVLYIFDDGANFSILQSTFHEAWSWKYGSTLKSDLRYSPTDCFETYPFPHLPLSLSLDSIGEKYYKERLEVMFTRQEGLTATYNRFHNPHEHAADIARLRELHVEMDHAVATAYGWQDLELGHDFHETAQGVRYTISAAARREVLARLLKLNHERYEDEVRQGLHEKQMGKSSSTKKSNRDSGKKKSPGQMQLI